MPTARPSLWIVGGGGLGREMWDYAVQAIAAGEEAWVLGGFVDDNPDAMSAFDRSIPVRGPIAKVAPDADSVFIMAIGDPRTKLALARGLEARGARFTNVVHPTAVFGARNRIGVGCMFGPHSGATCDGFIGDHVSMISKCGIGHDARLGDGCTLSGFSEVNGYAVLDEGVLLGSHAVVAPSVHMGTYSKAFAGAVVMKNVAPGVQVGGNPARIVPQL